MKTWKVTLTVAVAESWIDDGFDMTEHHKELEAAVRDMLPFALMNEVQVEVGSRVVKHAVPKERALQLWYIDLYRERTNNPQSVLDVDAAHRITWTEISSKMRELGWVLDAVSLRYEWNRISRAYGINGITARLDRSKVQS